MKKELKDAIAVFAKGHCVGKSVTHHYEANQIGSIWQLRDAPRKNALNYRKEEYVACGIAPSKVDSIAREKTRGRFFICDIVPTSVDDALHRREFKNLGYRLLATEPFFVHDLKRIPSPKNKSVKIELVEEASLAARLGKAMNMRPLTEAYFGERGLFRQYVALDGKQIVGWVRSVPAGKSNWCSTLGVMESHRRRGIGQTLLAEMLRADRRLGVATSVLLASHTGALLYPSLGYKQIGMLYIYAPKAAKEES
ncbi:MAG: GNAT family N-acetyltransferase [Pirellulaceae bacterium]